MRAISLKIRLQLVDKTRRIQTIIVITAPKTKSYRVKGLS